MIFVKYSDRYKEIFKNKSWKKDFDKNVSLYRNQTNQTGYKGLTAWQKTRSLTQIEIIWDDRLIVTKAILFGAELIFSHHCFPTGLSKELLLTMTRFSTFWEHFHSSKSMFLITCWRSCVLWHFMKLGKIQSSQVCF